MSFAGLRRSGRHAAPAPSSTSATDQHNAHNYSSTQPASLSSPHSHGRGAQSRRTLDPPPASALPPPPPPLPAPPHSPPSQSQSQLTFSLLVHDPDRNFILTPLTPGIPVSLRSRSQQQLDGLSAAVLMYVLHRHSALLPVRVSDINNKVLKDTAKGAGRVVLKDVARRLRVIFGLRLVEADRSQSAASSSSSSKAASSQRAGGADAGSSSGSGRKRGRPVTSNSRSSAVAASSSADSYLVIVDQPLHARARQLQIPLSGDGEDATTPKRLLSSWRAHSALLFATLALCAFTYKDGVIAEERLLFLLGGLFGFGSTRELRQTTAHVLFGDVPQLITHMWVEQQYVERVTLRSEDVNNDFTMYGGTEDDNKEPHYRVGVRGRLEVGYERLYRFMVEEVMDSEASEAGLKEMQRRDMLNQANSAQLERQSDGDSNQRLMEDGFAFSQPAANRRSNATINLPEDQRQTQRLAPYHQSVLRYLLAHSTSSESAVLAFYKQTAPPSSRSPNLDELYTSINHAIEWAALRVERVASEYDDERVWMIVSRSDADSALVFSAFSNEEVALFRAWLQTLVTRENNIGAADMTLLDMETIASHLDGVGKDRAKRLAEGSRELAERLARHGWLYSQRKVEPQVYSAGMRSFVELLKPRALAAAASSSASLSSSSSSSSFGSLTLRLHECGRCRFDVYFGLYCGTQQDEQPDCRQKYHYHCVQRVRRAGQSMKCRMGHTWKMRSKQQRQDNNNDDSDAQDIQAESEGVANTGSSRNSSRVGNRSSSSSSSKQRRKAQPEDKSPAAARGEGGGRRATNR